MQPPDIPDTKEAAQLEKELRKILDDIPELGEILGFRTRRPIQILKENGNVQVEMVEGEEITYPGEVGSRGGGVVPVAPGAESGEAPVETEEGRKKAEPISRKARRGPKIDFQKRPDQLELAWVEGGTIIINRGHPSYNKTHGTKSRFLLDMFAIACAVQRHITSSNKKSDLKFIDRMMAAWGSK